MSSDDLRETFAALAEAVGLPSDTDPLKVRDAIEGLVAERNKAEIVWQNAQERD